MIRNKVSGLSPSRVPNPAGTEFGEKMILELSLPVTIKCPEPNLDDNAEADCIWLNLIRKLNAALREQGEIKVELTGEVR